MNVYHILHINDILLLFRSNKHKVYLSTFHAILRSQITCLCCTRCLPLSLGFSSLSKYFVRHYTRLHEQLRHCKLDGGEAYLISAGTDPPVLRATPVQCALCSTGGRDCCWRCWTEVESSPHGIARGLSQAMNDDAIDMSIFSLSLHQQLSIQYATCKYIRRS